METKTMAYVKTNKAHGEQRTNVTATCTKIENS